MLVDESREIILHPNTQILTRTLTWENDFTRIKRNLRESFGNETKLEERRVRETNTKLKNLFEKETSEVISQTTRRSKQKSVRNSGLTSKNGGWFL